MNVMPKLGSQRGWLHRVDVCMMTLELEYDVEGVDDTGNVTKDGQQDVDEKVCVAAALKEDAQRGEKDGKDDFAEIAGGERHVGGRVCLFGSV